MHQLYALFENASGYALFRTNEFEEIAIFLPQVQKSILDISKFRSIVYLVAFHSFKNVEEALENMKCVAEGKLHIDLQLFLENNVPKSKKSKQSVVLGVQESGLEKAINETLGITCSTSGAVGEIIRGIRFHFHKLVKGYKDSNTILKSQLGLGHHYSRTRLNFNIHKSDSMITQSINMLDQLNKDINTLTLRVRHWYAFHFPELIKIVPDNELYIKCVKEIKDRLSMSPDIETRLEAILQDPEKIQKILEASRTSMGMKVAAEDIENIEKLIDQIISLTKRHCEMTEYLKVKMNKIAPSLATLLGELIGARLISQAGSLTNLSKFPASTVQILGAEKSLFRTLKTKTKENQKFGLLNQSTIGKAGRAAKGRMSRILANKSALASRIDCFSVKPTTTHGQILKQQVNDRLKFFETGKFPAELTSNSGEDKMEIFLAKKAHLKKRRKERKLKKRQLQQKMKANEPTAVTTNGLPEVPEESLSDDVQTEVKQEKRTKRKSKALSETEDTKEAKALKEISIQAQPKLKRKKRVIKR